MSTQASAFALSGSVDAENFAAWQARGEAFIAGCEEAIPCFDLSALESSNSLAVALLLAWLRYAARAQKSVQFAHSPAALRNIIQFSGLTQLLPLDA